MDRIDDGTQATIDVSCVVENRCKHCGLYYNSYMLGMDGEEHTISSSRNVDYFGVGRAARYFHTLQNNSYDWCIHTLVPVPQFNEEIEL